MSDEISMDPQTFFDRSRYHNDPSVFDDPNAGREQIAEAVWAALMRNELPPEIQALLGGIRRSPYGRMPFHRLTVHTAPAGSKIKFAEQIELAREQMEWPMRLIWR